ncbi:MAG: hypothetical protein DMG85_18225, partial [Acidobacteria bacterium]
MGRRSADSRCHLRNVPLFLPRGFPLARFRDTTAAAYLGGAGLSTLVLERRDIVGGCCVTEEIAPGCRASTTSYIASMLRPEVIRDLELASHGLRMVPCDPMLQVPFLNAQTVPWWADRDRTVAELRKISIKDAGTFFRVDDKLKKLARYLQPRLRLT